MKLVLVPSTLEFERLFTSERLKSWEDQAIVCRCCGVGPAASAFFTGHWIRECNPEMVILAGIAGIFRGSNLELGDVVCTYSDCFADLGVKQGESCRLFDPKYLPLYVKEDGTKLGCVYPTLEVPSMASVAGITVSTVTGNERGANLLREQHQADIENMEGAAVALACSFYEKKFYQIRSGSNWVGDRDKSNWIINEALENLNSVLQESLPNL